MLDDFLPKDVARPDLYIAAMGRSGSTMLSNWLTRAPDQLVFIEPEFMRDSNSRMLRVQLANFGMPVDDPEWDALDPRPSDRFRRIVGPRLAGKRWGLKEVLCSEHERIIPAFRPAVVLIQVRNIVDVALSFFEKHRAQANLDRFSDDWVAEYCARETDGLCRLQRQLSAQKLPHRIVRYEDILGSEQIRNSIADTIGWEPGGQTDMHLLQLDRFFEVNVHGRSISGQQRSRCQRGLDDGLIARTHAIAERCFEYQQNFGYPDLSSKDNSG